LREAFALFAIGFALTTDFLELAAVFFETTFFFVTADFLAATVFAFLAAGFF